MSDSPCTLYVSLDKFSCLPIYELQQKLEDSKVSSKIIAMENVILGTLKGDDLSSLLIPIIRYVISSSDHKLIKLVHLYFEIVQKTNSDSSIREEIILICNALRNYLNGPNEYVRGSTLRLLSKIKHWKILSPLVPSILQNLKHKEPYVRRYAVMCVRSIINQFGAEAIPDLITLMNDVLLNESDTSTKCKAFQLLLEFNPSLAVQYILSIEDSLVNIGDTFQTSIVKSLKKISGSDQACTTIGLRVVLLLMETVQAINVIYQGSISLLASGLTTIEMRKITAKTLVSILTSQPDVNIKLITLSNLEKLYKISNKFGDHPNVLESHLVDITRVLNNPYYLIVKECLALCLKLLTESNVGQLLNVLKKQFIKSCDNDSLYPDDYQATIINSITQICENFPIESEVVFDLFECLTVGNNGARYQIALFIYKLFNIIPELKSGIINKLIPIVFQITDVEVVRVCVYLLYHTNSPEQAVEFINLLYESLKPYPLTNKNKESGVKGSKARDTVMSPDSLLLSSLSSLIFKFASIDSVTPDVVEKSTLIVANLLMLAKENNLELGTLNKLTHILKVLVDRCQGIKTEFKDYFTLEYEQADLLAKEELKAEEFKAENSVFSPVLSRLYENGAGLDEQSSADKSASPSFNFDSRLISSDTIPYQMTGLADDIYIEILTEVINTELHLKMTITNTTAQLLQNIHIELYIKGNLKIMDKITPFKLSPNESINLKIRVRVFSSASGSIFGYLFYKTKSGGVPEVLHLSPISINMIDFVVPAFVTRDEFQDMWTNFEWENKLVFQTNVREFSVFLEKMILTTNMTLAGYIPPNKLPTNGRTNYISKYIEYVRTIDELNVILKSCSFFAANLFLRTIFNEDALANLSIAKDKNGYVNGTIRIRSADQEIVMSLGDLISLVQRHFAASPL